MAYMFCLALSRYAWLCFGLFNKIQLENLSVKYQQENIFWIYYKIKSNIKYNISKIFVCATHVESIK